MIFFSLLGFDLMVMYSMLSDVFGLPYRLASLLIVYYSLLNSVYCILLYSVHCTVYSIYCGFNNSVKKYY